MVGAEFGGLIIFSFCYRVDQFINGNSQISSSLKKHHPWADTQGLAAVLTPR